MMGLVAPGVVGSAWRLSLLRRFSSSVLGPTDGAPSTPSWSVDSFLHDPPSPLQPAPIIDQDTLHSVAALAHLLIEPSHVAALMKDLRAILRCVRHVQTVPVEGVEPLVALGDPRPQPLRSDEVTEGWTHEAILSNAPATQHGLFCVPAVSDYDFEE